MSPDGHAYRVAVVGGGAAGTLTAVNLLRTVRHATVITLIDRSGEPGPGVPYRTRNPLHRLNVPAARMSALPDDPGHFLEWLRSVHPDAAESSYATRWDYGRYLVDLLTRTAKRNHEPGRLTKVP